LLERIAQGSQGPSPQLYSSSVNFLKTKRLCRLLEEEISPQELTVNFASAAGVNIQLDQQQELPERKTHYLSHSLNGTFFPFKWAHNELVPNCKCF
jgi:hypothetical protein